MEGKECKDAGRDGFEFRSAIKVSRERGVQILEICSSF